MKSDGSFLYENYQVASFLKSYSFLTQESSTESDIYQFVEASSSEIDTINGTAKFTFYIQRDEPIDVYNKININWGVFNNSYVSSSSMVQGSTDSLEYQILAKYGDYFDRPMITRLYLIIFIGSVLGVFSPLFQILPWVILLLYLFFQPLFIYLFVDLNEEMTILNYILEVLIRWQMSALTVLFFASIANILTWCPSYFLGYYLYNTLYEPKSR